ncbi:hypothetical protein MASR1M45_24640 [Candidatus Kapaibacterium sp.]
MVQPDIAIIGIGAYQPEWFMAPHHIGPKDGLMAAGEMNAKRLIPMHYGTFDLSDEPIGNPHREIIRLYSERDSSFPEIINAGNWRLYKTVSIYLFIFVQRVFHNLIFYFLNFQCHFQAACSGLTMSQKAKSGESESNEEIGFFDHLDELRNRIIYAFLGVLAACIITGIFIDPLMNIVLLQPASKANISLQNLKPFGVPLLYFKVVFLSGLR